MVSRFRLPENRVNFPLQLEILTLKSFDAGKVNSSQDLSCHRSLHYFFLEGSYCSDFIELRWNQFMLFICVKYLNDTRCTYVHWWRLVVDVN